MDETLDVWWSADGGLTRFVEGTIIMDTGPSTTVPTPAQYFFNAAAAGLPNLTIGFTYNGNSNSIRLNNLSLTGAEPSAVPEPGPLGLIGAGLLGIGLLLRRPLGYLQFRFGAVR